MAPTDTQQPPLNISWYTRRTKLLGIRSLGAIAYGVHIQFRDRGARGAKHMSKLGGQPKEEHFLFSSHAYVVLSLSKALKDWPSG